MRLFSYTLKDDVVIKHVFTGNRQNLQSKASRLFQDIQLHVELCRQQKRPGISLS